MNRKNLTAAVLAGLAGTAGIASTVQAVNLNPDGLGQVLIYPYYTVNGGNLTLLSVVNTSEDAKAVKVRFLEGQNSQEVLDFNLYMSAYDVWTAAIVDDDGTPTLKIDDSTCTVPYLYRDFGGSQPFLTSRLALDGGSTDISRTSEGHFEMIEMGTLVNGGPYVDANMGSADAATHVTVDGVRGPSDCDQLIAAWTQGPDGDPNSSDDGYWLNPDYGPLTDIDDPSGGLFGGAAIINIAGGAMYSYDARAINGYAYSALTDTGPLHSFPGTEKPSLNDGDSYTGYVFTDTGVVASASFLEGVDAVSYVFMHDAIMNEYNIDPDLGASSEWVVTFPTKNFYVNSVEAKPPFTDVWSDHDGDDVNDGACEAVLLDSVWDREELNIDQSTTGEDCPPVVSPGEVQCGTPAKPFELCYETNVIRFGATDTIPGETEIFGSKNFTNFDPLTFTSGWARIDLMAYAQGNVGAESIVLRPPLYDWEDGGAQWGLPVTGFWAMRVANAFLGDGADVLANYGGLFNHKATRCFSGEACRIDLLGLN